MELEPERSLVSVNFTSTLGRNISYQNATNGTFTRNEDLARVEVIVQSVIFVLAVLGNSTVLLSLYRKRKSLTRMHHLMIHLSLADLFVAFGSVLPQLAWDITYVFKGGDILCRLVKYMQIVAIYASAYVLVMTAVDRYFAICFPLISHKWSNSMVRKMVVVAWSLSLLLSVPQLFIFSYKLNSYGMYDCWGTFEPEWTLTVYITTFTVLVYIIPAFILAFCYGSICIVVWKSGRIGERLGTRPRSTKQFGSTESNGKTLSSTMEMREMRSGSCSRKAGSATNASCDHQKNSGEGDEHKVRVGGQQWSQLTHDKRYKSIQNHDQNGCNIIKYYTTKDSPKTVLCTCIENNQDVTTRCARSGGKSSPHFPIKGAIDHAVLDKADGAGERRRSSCGNTSNSSPPRRSFPRSPRGCPNNRMADKRGASHGISRAKLRTIKLTLAVVICYLACWSPFFIAQMWAVYDPTAPFFGSAYTIILLLASLNSCTNPWIYLLFSESFITEFKQTSRKLTRVIRCSSTT